MENHPPCEAKYTKRDGIGRTLDFGRVMDYVRQFLGYAAMHPDMTFKVTRIGCGYAGFTDEKIAPLFANAPDNCEFDLAWQPYLSGRAFWGSFTPAPVSLDSQYGNLQTKLQDDLDPFTPVSPDDSHDGGSKY
jgi:hypothetical protein